MVADAKDPEIKLFGKTIPVREQQAAIAFSIGSSAPDPSSSGSPPGEDQTVGGSSPEDGYSMNGIHQDRILEKESLGGNSTETPHSDEDTAFATEQRIDPDRSSFLNETLPLKPEEEQSEACISPDKPLKKPDKIIPCPRCNSMETKFCYYNNYNVNQPRHFCKNCQRYWTAGGSMRNVPVGAGRRKNKNLASHYRQITVSESMQNVRNNESAKTNGRILAFGDAPLCESIASVMSLSDKTSLWNGFPKPDESGNPHQLNEPVITDTMENKRGSHENVLQSFHGFNPQLHCLPGAPWPYPWNAAPIYPTGYFPSPPFWGCSMPIPWLSQPSPISADPNSPNLGKHSRNEDSNSDSNSNSGSHKDEKQEEENSEKHFWIPKTLRMDDMGEAAKSSIWAKLGILSGKVDSSPSSSSQEMFTAFKLKDKSGQLTQNLHANPAALSSGI